MSFINKLIDRATRHNPKDKSQRRSFFGFGNPISIISNKESKIEEDQISANDSTKTKVEEDTDHTKDISTHSKCNQHHTSFPLIGDIEREKLRLKYIEYDKAILEQRRNKPKLRLNDFNLLRTLGTGSFGRVHLAQSKHNSRYYAVKVLKKTEIVRLKQVEHTNSEKQILDSAANPFMINLWGTFQDDINLYMVMDYVPGGELFSILRKNQRFPDHIAKFYAAEVVLAIEYFHSNNIIYRDLKPENLLLDAQGHIKIIDFGFAKFVHDITWTLCGTPDYLAPEVIQSKGYGLAADWWSLGILIFEMLTGFPPFYDDDHLKLYEKILQGKIKWPSYMDPFAKDLLKRLITPDLSRRYGNLKRGADDIKDHRWFSSIDYIKLANRQVRAPYIPTIRGEGDTSHFDKYPETNEIYGISGPDLFREKFADF
ncbi:camp-dependent protein kinase 1 [Pilobolus umbonatus]|nr:camp-dependent protein kinase 1 [Pilobolus umbonatus]